MAEIKSTLDLVMEKTRHLTMTEDEKHAQKEADARKSVNGLLQKYQDGVLGRAQLQRAFEALQAANDAVDETMLMAECLNRIQLHRDNAAMLELLRERRGPAADALEAVLAAGSSETQTAAAARSATVVEKLRKRHAISGTAVVANLEADPEWAAQKAAITRRFDRQLDAAKEKIKNKTG
jgi:hypothetical protein